MHFAAVALPWCLLSWVSVYHLCGVLALTLNYLNACQLNKATKKVFENGNTLSGC